MKKVLIVEDKPAMASILQDLMERDGKFDVRIAHDPQRALLEADAAQYNVFFVDLNFPVDGGTPSQALFQGIDLGAKLHRKFPDAVIIMYSGHITSASDFQYHSECVAAGANGVYSSSELSNLGAERLQKLVQGLLDKRATAVALRRPLRVADDVFSKSAAERIGEEQLSALIRQVIPLGNEDTVTSLTGGYSGAMVLRVETETGLKGGVLRNVMKVDRARRALERELHNAPVAGSSAASFSVGGTGRAVAEAGGWFAISAPEVVDSEPLAKYLLRKGRPSTKFFEEVVEILLIRPALVTKVIDDSASTESVSLRASFVAEVIVGLREISDLSALVNASDRRKATALTTFIERASKGHWKYQDRWKIFAELHGDFHSRNILVEASKTLRIIDLARRGWYPRLFDFAAFDSDLIFSVFDSRSGRSWDFRSVGDWEEVVTRDFPYQVVAPTTPPANSPLLLRSIMLTEMRRRLPSVERLEYAEALLFQILRYIRFPSIPLPKKVLAVRLADRLIAQSGL
jgi:DNA-binding NarL/FixJ family response regulator